MHVRVKLTISLGCLQEERLYISIIFFYDAPFRRKSRLDIWVLHIWLIETYMNSNSKCAIHINMYIVL
jgi:hypothetical protein